MSGGVRTVAQAVAQQGFKEKPGGKRQKGKVGNMSNATPFNSPDLASRSSKNINHTLSRTTAIPLTSRKPQVGFYAGKNDKDATIIITVDLQLVAARWSCQRS